MRETLVRIDDKIYEIRGQQVMFDFDLAELYGVETKRLKEQVRRNIERFPEDFMFELTKEEAEFSRSQIATLKTGSGSNIKYTPFAFTQNGVAMLSSVLRSPAAIQVNINIVRAFTKMRQYILSNKASDTAMADLKKQIEFLQEDMESLNRDQEVYDSQFEELYKAIGDISLKLQLKQTKLDRVEVKGYRQYE